METVNGTAPGGTPRRLDCWRLDDGRVAVWVHTPSSDSNGWQINVDPAELLQALVRASLGGGSPVPPAGEAADAEPGAAPDPARM